MAEYKTHTVAVDELDRLVTDIFTRAGCDAVEAARRNRVVDDPPVGHRDDRRPERRGKNPSPRCIRRQ
jgi:hypothetical protein